MNLNWTKVIIFEDDSNNLCFYAFLLYVMKWQGLISMVKKDAFNYHKYISNLNIMKNETLFWMNILWKRNYVSWKNWCSLFLTKKIMQKQKNQNLNHKWKSGICWTNLQVKLLKFIGFLQWHLSKKTCSDHLWLEFYLAVMSPHQSPNQSVSLRSGNRQNILIGGNDTRYNMLDVNFFVSQ